MFRPVVVIIRFYHSTHLRLFYTIRVAACLMRRSQHQNTPKHVVFLSKNITANQTHTVVLLTTHPLISSYTHNGDDRLQSLRRQLYQTEYKLYVSNYLLYSYIKKLHVSAGSCHHQVLSFNLLKILITLIKLIKYFIIILKIVLCKNTCYIKILEIFITHFILYIFNFQFQF